MNESVREQPTSILKGGNFSGRREKLRALRDTNPHEALDELLALMAWSDQTLRRRAGGALGSFRTWVPTKTSVLVGMLQNHEDEHVRLSCAIHLMSVRGTAVDQAYLAALKESLEVSNLYVAKERC